MGRSQNGQAPGSGSHCPSSVRSRSPGALLFPLACTLAPDLAALEGAVASGAARAIGGAALESLCSQLKAESKAAIGSMFAAISLQMSHDGGLIIGGSLGDRAVVQSVGWDTSARAVIYTATWRLLQPAAATGGEVQLSGDLSIQVRVSRDDGDNDQASVIAALAVAIAVGVVLAPTVEWAAGAEWGTSITAGVRQLLSRLSPVLSQ